jgi:alkylation response protein AidB-like acyl-CoA dehydrogenase
MSAMRYALTASERAFKESVREFAGGAVPASGDGALPVPGMPGTLPRELGNWLSALRPAGLSRVEEVVALEETARRCPAAAPGLIGSGLFGAPSPGLCRAAADLGAAQGVLARGLAGKPKLREAGGALLQSVADVLTGIETARLKLYRAAILEDAGREDPEETAGAERFAEALFREAGSLMERMLTGGTDETRNAV